MYMYVGEARLRRGGIRAVIFILPMPKTLFSVFFCIYIIFVMIYFSCQFLIIIPYLDMENRSARLAYGRLCEGFPC